jgi:hypothetical protein
MQLRAWLCATGGRSFQRGSSPHGAGVRWGLVGGVLQLGFGALGFAHRDSLEIRGVFCVFGECF